MARKKQSQFKANRRPLAGNPKHSVRSPWDEARNPKQAERVQNDSPQSRYY